MTKDRFLISVGIHCILRNVNSCSRYGRSWPNVVVTDFSFDQRDFEESNLAPLGRAIYDLQCHPDDGTLRSLTETTR